MQRLFAVALAVVAVCVGIAPGSFSDAAHGLSAAVCPVGSDAAVVGGNRVCLKVGLPCLMKYQALYRGHGYVCGNSKRLDSLVCTGGRVYAVIGGVHGCIKEGQTCKTKFAAQYAKYGLTCESGRLVKQTPINPKIIVSGPEEVVYDWSRDHCEENDIPDLPARAFRDASGRVQLTISHFVNRRMVGPDLGHLTHDCKLVLGSAGNPDPAAFNDKQWLSSVYTTDGTTVYALVNVEYQGNTHPGQCPSGEYIRCWWNTLVLSVSKDGGNSYQRPGPRNGLVAASPYRYQPDLGFEGPGGPSQIVRNPADGYYYTIIGDRILSRPSGEPSQGGACLIRTHDLADPTSWRTTDTSGAFTRTFIDPYTQSDGPPLSHVCGKYIETRPGNPPGSPFHNSLSWNTYLQRWLLVGMDQANPQTGAHTWGIYFATSKDLRTWTTQRLLIEKTTVFNNTCADPTGIEYPSVIDPASPSRSFETTGQTAYLYYTVIHFSNCQLTLDRDLVRVPITINK